MELSQLWRKQIINLHDGSRLGYIGESDLVIDDHTGCIHSIIVYGRTMGIKGKNARELVIPWEAVKKIGEEIVVVDLAPGLQSRRYGNHE